MKLRQEGNESKEEARVVADRRQSFKPIGHIEKHELPVKDELPSAMHTPKDAGEKHMGGVHKGDGHIGNAGMGHAVKHLERETERHEHVATVAGEKMHGHSGHNKKY